MADDPNRDIIPTKETKRSYPASEISFQEKHSPEKRFTLHLSKADLEDQFYKFKEENLQLKKATRKQEDELKKLATKMNRLLREKKSLETMSNPGYKRDLELEEMVEELQDKVRQLEKSNTQLREKALVAKQQVIMQNRRPNPYNHIPAKVNSGVYKNPYSPYIVPMNLKGRNVQNSPKKSISTPLPPYALSLLDEARNELDNLKMLVSAQKTEIEMFEQENDILKQKMRMREIEFDDELNSLKSQITQRQRQHVQENLDLIRLHREVNQKNTKILTIQSQYSDLEEKIRQIKLSHDHLLKDKEELTIEYKNEQKKSLELLGELQKAEINFSELQEKIKSLMKENDLLMEANKKLTQNNVAFEKERSFNQMEEILKGKITNLESLLEIQSKTKSSIEEELIKERDKVKLKDDAYNQLKYQTDQMKFQIESLEAKLKILKEEDIDFTDLGKAIYLFKQSKRSNDETLAPLEPKSLITNHTEELAVEQSCDSTNKITDSQRNGSDTNLIEDYKKAELALSTASAEIEELKSKLVECENNQQSLAQELDTIKSQLAEQQTINERAQEEIRHLTEKLECQDKEFKLKLEEYSHLLDIRAARIQKLEKQLTDIAYGTKTYSLADVSDNESSTSVKLSRGENIFEIQIKKIQFTNSVQKQFSSSSSNIFLTWNFYEFELQSTPLVSSKKPIFDFTAQYTIQVDDYFLSYLHNSFLIIELHESLGVDFRTLAHCQLKFSDIFKKSTTKIEGSETLFDIEKSSNFEYGSLEYQVQLKIPMEDAFKFFKEKIKALKYLHSNKETSTTAVQLLNQPFDKNSNKNQLNIKILRARNLISYQKDIQPTSYCVYKFYDFPDQDTSIVPASNNPEYLDHHTFSLYIDPIIEKYLKNENLLIYVFDDNDPNINSYVGKVSIPLSPLIQNKEIKGSYMLNTVNNEPSESSIEVSIYWEHEYQPATSDINLSSASNQETIQDAFKNDYESSSEAETAEQTLDYTLPTPPVPKPRKIPAKQTTSTPIANNSETSSLTDDDGTSPNLSPVRQVYPERAPKPSQRKSKLGTEAKKLYTIKEKMKKIYDNEFSDEMSDSDKRLSFEDSSSAEDGKNNLTYDYSEESEDESDTTSNHTIKKQSDFIPSIMILISYLTLKKDASVLNDSSIKLLYVEYQFLNYPIEELETPVSLPKKGYPEKIEYNFKKVFTLEPNNLEKWNLLSEMITSDTEGSSLIKFTVVSEPSPDEQDLDCDDVGYGFVDLHEILTNQKDFIKEDIPICSARDSNSVIGILNISVQALEALLFLEKFTASHS